MAGEQKLVWCFPEIRRTGAGTAVQIHHSHPELEFNFVLSGRGTIFLEDGQHDLRPGCLVWMLPHQPHRLLRSPDLDMWVGSMPAHDCEPRLIEDVARNPARVLSREDAIEFDRLLTYISQDSDDPELYRSGLGYAFRCARRLSLTSQGAARTQLHRAVLKALKLLRSSEEVLSAAALARKCGVTQDYLARLIAEQTGRGIVEWRNRFRLERFHVRYPESHDLLTAALAAGFGSYTQFHRVFVELVGTTPGEWAKSGTHASTVALPSASNVLPNLESGSSRMNWYILAETPLPSASRWIGKDFATAFSRAAGAAGAEGEEAPVPSFVGCHGDLRQFEGALVAELAATSADEGVVLGGVLRRNDIFHAFKGTLAGGYNLDLSDFGDLFGLYISIASMVANHAPPLPSLTELGRVTRQARLALRATGSFEQAREDDRARVAAAVIAQTMFLRNAIYAARSRGSDELVERVADAAHRTALATLGLDVRANRVWKLAA